ncbi:MAG: hypothetical protein ABS910_05700 [Arthrobacter sp.]
MFLHHVDRTARKSDIKDALLAMATNEGQYLSDARADKLANKFKKGEFDPILARFIQYSDPTGEKAAKNVDAERLEVAA